MMAKKFAFIAVAIALAMSARTVLAGNLINFEDQTVDDTQVLTTDYKSLGISIVAQPGTKLFYERSGKHGSNVFLPNGVTSPNPREGFVSDTASPATYDREAAAFAGQLGNFFLRGDPSADPNNQWPGNKALPFFSIAYLKAPTELIGGEIWDIDGVNNTSEKWSVIARDSGGAQLAIQTSPEHFKNDAASLDSKPWLFEFDPSKLSSPIAKLDFVFTGTKNVGIGVAFDNFQSGVAPVPEPSTCALLITGLGIAGLASRRRRKLETIVSN